MFVFVCACIVGEVGKGLVTLPSCIGVQTLAPSVPARVCAPGCLAGCWLLAGPLSAQCVQAQCVTCRPPPPLPSPARPPAHPATHLQGDKEREAGLPMSPLCDRQKQGIGKSQVC